MVLVIIFITDLHQVDSKSLIRWFPSASLPNIFINQAIAPLIYEGVLIQLNVGF